MESELDRLRKKVENFPSASLYNRLAELARDAGAVDEAAEVCRRCMREFPRNGQSYVILAEILLEKSQRQDAMTLLQSAVDRDPRNVASYMMLANIFASDGDLPRAMTFLRQAGSMKPNDAHISARISELERKQGVSPASAPPAGDAGRANAASTSTPGGGEPLVPFAGPITTAVKAAAAGSAPSRTAALDALCSEPGVRGALVADMHGRVVIAKNLTVGQDEILAALASEIMGSALACQTALGVERLTTWALIAGAGQALAFQRDKSFSVVVLADVSVRPAMLELRARQTLIDLGAA